MSNKFNVIYTTDIDKLTQAKHEYQTLYQQMEQLENHMQAVIETFIQSFMKMQIEKYHETTNEYINIVLDEYTHRFIEKQDTDSQDNWMGSYMFNFGDLILEENINKRSFIVKENETHVWVWFFTEKNAIVIDSIKKEDAKFICLVRCDIDDEIESLSRVI